MKLHIVWKKDGEPLSSGLSDYNRRLTILNPTLGDSGYYECEAVLRSSSVPAVAEGAFLAVLGKGPALWQPRPEAQVRRVWGGLGTGSPYSLQVLEELWQPGQAPAFARSRLSVPGAGGEECISARAGN